MDGIKLMVDEHLIIKRMLKVVQNICFNILKGEEICYEDFQNIIDFIRNFADGHHHAKEEKFLFNEMVSEIGEVAEKLVRYGMLVEHDLGRLYVQQLEDSLVKVKNGNEKEKIQVIANAVSYTNLLYRHIDKEDNVVYTFAQRELKNSTIEKINKACEKYENEITSTGLQKKYLDIVIKMEERYI